MMLESQPVSGHDVRGHRSPKETWIKVPGRGIVSRTSLWQLGPDLSVIVRQTRAPSPISTIVFGEFDRASHTDAPAKKVCTALASYGYTKRMGWCLCVLNCTRETGARSIRQTCPHHVAATPSLVTRGRVRKGEQRLPCRNSDPEKLVRCPVASLTRVSFRPVCPLPLPVLSYRSPSPMGSCCLLSPLGYPPPGLDQLFALPIQNRSVPRPGRCPMSFHPPVTALVLNKSSRVLGQETEGPYLSRLTRGTGMPRPS